jgi:hypothetical protein
MAAATSVAPPSASGVKNSGAATNAFLIQCRGRANAKNAFNMLRLERISKQRARSKRHVAEVTVFFGGNFYEESRKLIV